MSSDPKGYYAILGIEIDADSSVIKKAYRVKAKELHPDQNTSENAEDEFRLLSDAYSVLSDDVSRNAYDALGGKTTVDMETCEFSSCCCCGVVSAQPRYVVFKEVVSKWFKATEKMTCGVYCSKCAAKTAFILSMKTWLLGWWSLKGLYLTPKVLFFNLMGGEKPKNRNFQLLMQQAQSFLYAGNPDFASSAAKQAREFMTSHDDRNMVDKFMTALSGYEVKRLKDSWKKYGRAFYLQLMPFLLIVFVLLGIGIYKSGIKITLPSFSGRKAVSADSFGSNFAVFDIPEVTYHTSDEEVKVYYAPDEQYDVLKVLEKSVDVTASGVVPQTRWVRVVLKSGEIGFVDKRFIKKGSFADRRER